MHGGRAEECDAHALLADAPDSSIDWPLVLAFIGPHLSQRLLVSRASGTAEKRSHQQPEIRRHRMGAEARAAEVAQNETDRGGE